MSKIIFKLEFIDRVQNNIKIIFDFTNPLSNHKMSRTLFFTLSDKKGDLYKEHIIPYIQFLINHKMLTESMLSLSQDKMLKYIIFKYPRSYPSTKKGVPPGISRYFNRQNYDRYCLNKDSEQVLCQNMNTCASKYPARLLAPDTTGNSGKTTLILGSSYSGKTYLLCNEIQLLKTFEYDLIILFTESKNVPCLDKIRNREDLIIIEGFNSKIPLFLQRLNSNLGLRYRFLLILDDIISEKSNRQSILGKMITTYRNSNISTCVLLQYASMVEKSARGNFHQLVVTGIRSMEGIKSFSDKYDVLYWAKQRMKNEGNTQATIKNEEVYTYLKHLLMEDGVVLFIDLKKSCDPSVVNLNN